MNLELESRLDRALSDADRLAAPAKLRQPVKEIPPPRGPYSFGFDAALPGDGMPNYWSGFQPFAIVAAHWESQIIDESLRDYEISYYRTPHLSRRGLSLRAEDGALCFDRDELPLAYTQRAWSQLVALFLADHDDKPRGPAEPYRWLAPSVRAFVFAHLRDRSLRKEGDDYRITLRTYVDQREKYSGVRSVRAALSSQHAGVHFDDLAMIRVLEKLVPAGADAWVTRTIDHTIGHAVLADRRHSLGAEAMLSWSNSETAAGSIGFGSACRIRVLDNAVLRSRKAVTTDTMAPLVTLRAVSGTAKRSHRLPRVNVDEATRARIAAERMHADIKKATAASVRLVAAWEEALVSKPQGLGERPADPKLEVEVLMDIVNGHSWTISADDRKALVETISDSEQLRELPFGSVAHVAGAIALLAKRQKDLNETLRLQIEAGRWVEEVRF